MSARVSQTLPVARTERLVVRELPDELLVYDLERQKAHCLNNTSAIVWKHCDGKATVEEMTRLLEKEFSTHVDEDIVWLALSQLRRLHLLNEEDKKAWARKVSRRDLVLKYLPAAMALPVILSISAPTAAQAASGPCGLTGSPCGGGQPACCTGLSCQGGQCLICIGSGMACVGGGVPCCNGVCAGGVCP